MSKNSINWLPQFRSTEKRQFRSTEIWSSDRLPVYAYIKLKKNLIKKIAPVFAALGQSLIYSYNTKRFPFHESEWIRLVIVLAPPQNHISSSNDLLLQFITYIFILYLLDFFLSGLNWVLLYFLLIILAVKRNSYFWFGTLGYKN